jgi:signal transduction histidine kinase
MLTGVYFANAQVVVEKNFTNISTINDSIFLKDCLVFIDSFKSLNSGQVIEMAWKPLSSYKIKTSIPASWITKRVYLQLNLFNSDSNATTAFFYPGFCYNGFKTTRVASDNFLAPLKDFSKKDGFQPITLPANTKQTFIVELNFTKTGISYLLPQIINKNYLVKYQKVLYYGNEMPTIVGYLISGALLMMFFFSMTNFFLTAKREFFLNACYVGCMFVLIFFSNYFNKKSGMASSFFLSYFSFFLLSVGMLFYIAFTRKFLDTRINFPLLDRVFFYAQAGFLVLLIVFTYLHFFSNNYKLQNMLENALKIIALLIGIVYIVVAFSQRNKLLNYLAFGNGLLIFFAVISFYFLLFPSAIISVFTKPIFYYEMGIVSELIFFILGLTYKNRVELIGTIQQQEAMKLEAEKQLYESRIAILNAQQQERNRISADMHDDMGAGITSIRLFSELAKNKIDKSALPEIEKISAAANELLNNMNAIIWTMGSNNNSFADVISYIRSYAQEYFDNTGIACKIEIPDDLPEFAISSKARRNVFLVIKEALHNILKHANATTVSITLAKEPGRLSLYIQDNGNGIDFDKVRRFGNGLNNMKRRMEETNILFSVENNNGTQVKLQYLLPTVQV